MNTISIKAITGKSRPSSYDDLADYERAGHPVATINADMVVRFPSLGLHLLAALNEAKELGLTVEDGQITTPRTTDELDESLASAQRSWDTRRDQYLNALDDPDSITEDYRRRWINEWARKEGVREIDWTASS